MPLIRRNPGRKAFLAFLAALFGTFLAFGGPGQAQDASPTSILKIFSVGGVLTADGTLWQYSPSQKWQTIDQAFRDQGRETHILPLPVPAHAIEEMVTFGFLKTTSGEVWLYDLEDNEWQRLDPPR
jgi:hypothetical protein